MKKLLLYSLLCLGVLGGARAQTCTTITNFPYYESFDGAAATGWTSGVLPASLGASSWALGKPAKPVINSAASGSKCWVTGLTGNYNPSEQSYVLSPCFNMSTLTLPVVEMKVWWNSEFSNDGAVLQSSIDGGTTWTNVGVKGDPNNWYNDNTINAGPGGQAVATAEGWTGRTFSSNGSNGWVTVKHALTGLAGKPNVKLRIAFGSDFVLNQDDGFAFDNFTVYDTPAIDASLLNITAPVSPVLPGSPVPVSVTVKNYGTSPLNSVTLGYSVNGVVQPTFPNTFTTPLAANNGISNSIQIGTFSFPAGKPVIKAWTQSPNAGVDGNPSNDTTSITINSCNPLSGIYTIDKGSSASATNFTSFTLAIQALSSCGVNGPVTFTVAPNSGTYIEALTIPNIAGTSATNTITFNGNGNTVSSSPTSSAGAVVKLDGAKFIRINNLKVEVASNSTLGAGVLLANTATNNIFTGCTINISLTATSVNLQAITLNTGSSNNTFQNNTINGGYNGISHSGSTNPVLTGNVFTGNILKDQFANGFNCTNSTNITFEGNDISRPTRLNTLGAFTGVTLGTGTVNTIISKNRIHNTHDAVLSTTGQVYGVNTSAAAAGKVNIIKNNLIYNINNIGGTAYGFLNGNGTGTYYYYNTVSADNPAISYGSLRGISFTNATTADMKFVNNIISLSSPATNKYAIYLGTTSNALVSDNNDLFVGTTGNIGYSTADKKTISEWRLANPTAAYDLHSVTEDPIFVNPANNLLPQSTAVNNTGQALTDVTDDINGTLRSTTTPDPGAYEFTPISVDAGVTAILSLTTPVKPGISQPVQVTLRNFGTTTLTSATIGWSVNGAIQPTYAWSGNLTNLQSAPVSIGNYTFSTGDIMIKAWSKNPNGLTDGQVANDTTVLRIVSCDPLVGNYTINKNNPTAGTNFQSITAAVQRLSICGVAGAVTLTVAPGTGTYNEVIEIPNIPFTSATNTVTFEGSGNIISGTPVAKPGIIVLNGAKYVTLNNFVITLNPSATSGWGVQLINAADFNTISNNTINLVYTSTSNVNGIIAGTAPRTQGNNTSNTKILNNTINGGYYGIQINGNTGGLNADNNQIVGNTIKDALWYGIDLSDANGTLIEKNDISRPLRTDGTTFTNVWTGGICLKTIISKNRMHNANDKSSDKTGVVYGILNGAAATPGNENIIKNNIIYNTNNVGGAVYAFCEAPNSSGNYYYNNTLDVDPAISHSTLRGLYFFGTSTNVKFINNIISLPGTATTAKQAIYIKDNTGTALEINYNDLFIGTTGNIGYFNGTNAPDTTAWKAINNKAYDKKSTSIDPKFVSSSTGNLKPAVATLDNLGQPLAAVTDDILGAVRNAIPDMGAFEFGIAANDVGIASVSGPGTTGCGLSATETITVTIKNYGANPQTFVPVNLSVNGTVIATETYTGSIAPNATANYTFTAKANLATAGPYVIIANTLLTGDGDLTNNFDTLNITNSLISGLPITFDFETAATGVSRFRKVTNPKSNITEGAAASNGTGSTKGMIMDGVASTNWNVPAGSIDPWTNNPDNFAATYICVNPDPAGGYASDSLWMTFDLKQLFKTANANTNFRVTVNGIQVGATYRPTFNGVGGTTNWTNVKVDLTTYKNDPVVSIGLESSVKEAYANGTGTANLIDNIEFKRRIKKVAANDVGVIAISGPSTTGCGLTATETVTVTVKNLGALPQASSFPVSFSVDGGTVTTETFPGPLAANATATYTFTTAKANLSAVGPHAIVAKTALPGDTAVSNDATTLNITNSLISGLPIAFDFETPATGISRFRTVINTRSNITEATGASFGGTSTKGMIMDGVDDPKWVVPGGSTNPWAINAENFSAAYICISPAGGAASDSLWMTLDMKQLFKTAAANTNFRVTVNGTQVGATYRPTATSTWQKVKVDLTAYKNDPTVTLGLESSVKEAYAAGNGTANLIDNINIVRRVANTTGLKGNLLASQVHVFPNPSKGQFNVNLPGGKAYELTVTDLTGKVIKHQQANGNAKLNLEGTAKGIYLLKVSGENGSAVRKLIVE